MTGELVVVAGLAGLAGACAYTITAAELRHHYSDRRRPRGAGLRAAAMTAVVFGGLGAFLFWIAPRLV